MPDAVEKLEITVRILGGDGDSIAGLKLQPIAQGSRKPRGAAGQVAIACYNARARRGRPLSGVTETSTLKP